MRAGMGMTFEPIQNNSAIVFPEEKGLPNNNEEIMNITVNNIFLTKTEALLCMDLLLLSPLIKNSWQQDIIVRFIKDHRHWW